MQLLQDDEELLAGEGDEGSCMPPQAGLDCLHPLASHVLQPPGFSPFLFFLHSNHSGDLVSRGSWHRAVQSSSTCGTSLKMLLGMCSPRGIHVPGFTQRQKGLRSGWPPCQG